MRSKAAITVLGSPDEVERRWRDSEHRIDAAATRFAEAPGDRGTEIHLEADAPLGKLKDDLRRFKQLFETGEIARSDAAPDGELAERKLRQPPAQPVEAS